LSKKSTDNIGYDCLLSGCAYSEYQSDEDFPSDRENGQEEKGEVEGYTKEPLEAVLNSVIAVVSSQ
jgi:hypothetical protein